MIQRTGVNQSVQTVSQQDIQEIPEIQLPAEAGDDWEGGKGGKVRLMRSEAIRDSSSPPPGQATSEAGDGGETAAGDTVSCTDSGRGDTDTPDGEIYTDNTGTDLTQFIISTLNKNAKDKVLMLKLEQEMSNLVKDSKKTHHKFPHMSSYHRMMVHRLLTRMFTNSVNLSLILEWPPSLVLTTMWTSQVTVSSSTRPRTRGCRISSSGTTSSSRRWLERAG